MWLRACNREDLNNISSEELHKNYQLCEKHFQPGNFSVGSTRKRLFENVVPTIFWHTPAANENDAGSTSTAKANDDFLSTPGTSKTTAHFEGKREIGVATSDDVFSLSGPSKRTDHIEGEQDIDIATSDDFLTLPGPSKRTTNFEDEKEMVASTSVMHVPLPKISPSVGSQTPMSLSATSPRKVKLRRKLRAVRKANKKTSSITRQWTINDFKAICEQFLNQPLADIVKAQAELKDKKPLARRYSKEYKQFALTLYFLGPRAYSYMSKILCLPSKRCLQNITAKLVTQPGLFNESIFKALEIKVQTMIEVDKHCSICIDEMSLKSNLFYNTSRDELVGLHDMGLGTKEFLYAQNALVIMVRGLYNNWKQPLAYFFLSGQFGAHQLKDALEQCVLKLHNIGLIVDVIVSDMGTNFVQLSKLLGVTENNSEIELGGNKITYLFDVCHLIKAARNNLLKNIIQFNDKKTAWVFIQSFYEQDSKQFYRCAPKLTRAHLFPTNFQKLKVKLATQVLSHTVASGINVYLTLGAIPSDAIGTVEFIEKCNNLFDILNSTDLNARDTFKKVFQGEPFQLDFLNEMLSFLQELQIFNKDGKNLTTKTKFKKCWIVTINGLLSLWSKLSAVGFKYLKTRRLNTDCLENFVGSVRQQGGNAINPTPIQFKRAFKKLFCQSYLHSNNMNCKDDLDDLLIHLDAKKIISLGQEINESQEKAISINEYDYRLEDITVQNPFKYVCGYLIKKTLSVHRCDICTKFSKECEILDITQLLSYFKAYDSNESIYGGLRTPNENFIKYIYTLEKIFLLHFNEICLKPGISHKLLDIMKEIDVNHPCTDFPKMYLLKLFIRLRIFYTVKYLNQDLKENKKDKSNKNLRKINIVSHL